ncbi:MAG: hypothetical protein Q9166_004046 [cf. Caloplaca sp. 2 TL-2023]
MDFKKLQQELAATRQELAAAEQNLAAERRRREEAEKAIAKVPLPEFLQACHQHLHCPASIQPIKSFTTAGPLSVPKNRYRPDRLVPWDDFPDLTQNTLDQVQSHLQPLQNGPPLHLFAPPFFTEQLGELCVRPLANEMDVRKYENVTVELLVAAIIKELAQVPQARTKYHLADGVIFENEPSSVSATPQTPPSRTESASDESDFEEEKDRTRADQYCVRKQGINNRLIQIVEYKAPHKLTTDTIRTGFRSMVIEEVLLRQDIPPIVHSNDEAAGKKRKRQVWKSEEERTQATEERFQYDADCLVTAVAIQTFHYMIASGLSYSYIATGIAFIFLHINYDEPSTLQYHVSVPDQTIKDLPVHLTAVGQVLAVCLLASTTDQQRQAVRIQVRKKLSKTPCYSFDDVLNGSTPSTVKSDSVHSEYHETPRHKKKKHDDEDSDGGQSPTPRTTRARNKEQQAERSTVQSNTSTSRGQKNQGGHGGPQSQYCTQKCLLGLMRGNPLDPTCPNAPFHNSNGSEHLVGATEFPKLVRDQLAGDLDEYCVPLGLSGARGFLFRVTLASHGYVFVAKGTTRRLRSRLLHEGKMYEHLKALQGTAIPVHLGNVNLVHRYFLDWHPIKHFLLLSWGGDNAGYDEMSTSQIGSRIELEVERTWRQVWMANVDQGDYRGPNFLWNAEANRVMLIDFERAKFRHVEKPCAAKETKPVAVIEHPRLSNLKRKAGAMVLVDSKHTKTRNLPVSNKRRRSDDGLVN